MEMTASQTPPRTARYTLGAREARTDTLKLVDEIKEMLAKNDKGNQSYSDQTIGRAIELYVLKALNAERKELAALARELDVNSGHPEICAAATRLGSSATADVAISVCRGLLARLCVERISTG